MKEHIKTIHEGIKDSRCEICGKLFSQAGAVKYHIKRVHEGVRDYQCDHCGQAFAGKQGLHRCGSCAYLVNQQGH